MKLKSQFVCQECRQSYSKWLGRCGGCGAWNSLIEEMAEKRPMQASATEAGSPVHWNESNSLDDKSQGKRIKTGMIELDRVLGGDGGLVPDSFVLLGGDPGIGKSTLVLQLAKGIHRSSPEKKILIVSGEESVSQIRARAKRIELDEKSALYLMADTVFENIESIVNELKPEILVIDSLQTIAVSELASAAGSVSQVREVASRLMQIAKKKSISVWLVGHVTKDGSIAGPKVVEHMVDTVLYFEGDRGQNYRLLRSVKNRFGAAHEIGVFEMSGFGLREVLNPSEIFLTDRPENLPGTSTGVSLEGTRPILLELQALTAATSFSMPKRNSIGMDASRLSMLAAVIDRHLDMELASQDIYFNVVGGMKLSDPGIDLAACAAILSSFVKRPVSRKTAFIGEVGLTGEILRVSQPEFRLDEVMKLGYEKVVMGRAINKMNVKGRNCEVVEIGSIGELMSVIE